jgi:hypothetical protein
MRSHRLSFSHRALWTLFVSVLATACVSETPPIEDEDMTFLARAESYRTWRRINRAPYASGLKGTINVYVSPEGADAYAGYHPDRADDARPIPEGTVIVREVLDATGAVTKVTMMAKGPRGYQPELGDWWFAVTDGNMVPQFGEDTWEIGRMPSCHSCHVPHANDDFVFGVPDAVR